MTPQAMSELVSYLERHDSVRRVPDPVDRRGRVVVYADRGTTAAKVAASFLTDVESRWDGIVGPDRFHEVRPGWDSRLLLDRQLRHSGGLRA